MRPSLPARSSKARTTAVMASTPPSRSYREPSTVPTSCALVTNGPATDMAVHHGQSAAGPPPRRLGDLISYQNDGKGCTAIADKVKKETCRPLFLEVLLDGLFGGLGRGGGGLLDGGLGQPCLRDREAGVQVPIKHLAC